MSKISIITAAYNSERFIEESIKSVISQSDDEVEYIIIDGGSKDKTVDIIEKYQESIDYWISERDSGIYDAWNKGLKVATGDWIMFLGTDDYLKPNAIKAYREFLSQAESLNETLFISSKMEIIDENKNIIRILGWEWKWKEFKRRHLLAHPGALHAAKLFKDYGNFDVAYKVCGDYELLLRPKEKLNGLFLDIITAQMTDGGASTNPKMLKEHYYAVTRTAGTNKFIAIYDYCVQYVKLFLKNHFKKLGINLKLRKQT